MNGRIPQSLQDIVEVVGLPAALRLAQAYGGVRVYVPREVKPGHTLENLLGREAAAALAERFPREVLWIPRCAAALAAERNAEIRRRYDGDESAPALAREYGLTERHVRRILAVQEEDPRQGFLF